MSPQTFLIVQLRMYMHVHTCVVVWRTVAKFEIKIPIFFLNKLIEVYSLIRLNEIKLGGRIRFNEKLHLTKCREICTLGQLGALLAWNETVRRGLDIRLSSYDRLKLHSENVRCLAINT